MYKKYKKYKKNIINNIFNLKSKNYNIIMIEINNPNFNKIITDLLKDLVLVFPDILEKTRNEDIINILKFIEFETIAKKEYNIVNSNTNDNQNDNNEDDNQNDNNQNDNNKDDKNQDDKNNQILEKYIISCNNILLYCINLYPKYFFEIIYKNEKLFFENYEDNSLNNIENEVITYNTFFLPDIDFKILFNDVNISENTRNTIWNYLQLILVSIVNNIDSKQTFGDTAKLFEAIDSDKLFSQFNDIIENFKNVSANFDSSTNILNDFSKLFDISNNVDYTPDVSSIYNHLNGILDGKIGKLATEFSEELYKELFQDLDINEAQKKNPENINDVYKLLFKNPGKLFNLVQKMGTKLDNKIKSGELSQQEIIEESTKIFGSMTNTDISGMDSMQLFKDMVEGFANNKNFNKTGFNNMINKEKIRSKMREKLNKKQETSKESNDIFNTQNEEKIRNNLFDLLKDESKDLKDLNENLEKLMKGFDTNVNDNKPKKKIKKLKKK